MLNEINRDEVRALLLGWISGRFNELPSRKDAGCCSMNIRRDVRNVCLWHLADFDAGSEYVRS